MPKFVALQIIGHGLDGLWISQLKPMVAMVFVGLGIVLFSGWIE